MSKVKKVETPLPTRTVIVMMVLVVLAVCALTGILLWSFATFDFNLVMSMLAGGVYGALVGLAIGVAMNILKRRQ